MALQRDSSDKLESRIRYVTYSGVNISFRHGGLRPCEDLNTVIVIRLSCCMSGVVVPAFSSSPI